MCVIFLGVSVTCIEIEFKMDPRNSKLCVCSNSDFVGCGTNPSRVRGYVACKVVAAAECLVSSR